MPWGAHLRPTASLRIATTAAMIFWLGLITFVVVELAFDGVAALAAWWLGPLTDSLVFIVWCAVCVATTGCVFAIRTELRRFAGVAARHVEPATVGAAGASPGEEGQCNAL